MFIYSSMFKKFLLSIYMKNHHALNADSHSQREAIVKVTFSSAIRN